MSEATSPADLTLEEEAVDSIRCKDEKPAEPKCANVANLEDRLKAIEQMYGAEGPEFARPRAIASVLSLSASHYRAGMDLYAYHQTLHHGAWLPAIRELSRGSTISIRTLLESVAQYEQVKNEPPVILDAMLAAGLDPAAPGRAALLRCAVKEWVEGSTPDKAVALAVDFTKVRGPRSQHKNRRKTPAPNQALSPEERDTLRCREQIIRGVVHVSEERKAAIVQKALPAVFWYLGIRTPVTIVPAEPIYDVLEPEQEPESGHSPERAVKLSAHGPITNNCSQELIR